jgi:hypothetical protein
MAVTTTVMTDQMSGAGVPMSMAVAVVCVMGRRGEGGRVQVSVCMAAIATMAHDVRCACPVSEVPTRRLR